MAILLLLLLLFFGVVVVCFCVFFAVFICFTAYQDSSQFHLVCKWPKTALISFKCFFFLQVTKSCGTSGYYGIENPLPCVIKSWPFFNSRLPFARSYTVL